MASITNINIKVEIPLFIVTCSNLKNAEYNYNTLKFPDAQAQCYKGHKE